MTEPDVEIASITLDPQTALYVASRNRRVAAVELISPRNKDRPSSRVAYFARYLSYLQDGAHVLLVDVHRRPLNFSFADSLAAELQFLNVGAPLPEMPLPLTVHSAIGVDLEQTYQRAAADAYLT